MHSLARPRGFTLVELLIGIVIALIVALGTASLLGRSLSENRRLLVEARTMQDLRGSLDLMVRAARRAGYWGASDTTGLWSSAELPATANPNTQAAPEVGTASAMSIRHTPIDSPVGAGAGSAIAFRLRSGAVEALIGDGHWQALTDAQSVVVTALTIRPHTDSAALEVACDLPAAAGARPAIARIRTFDIELTGRAAADASVVHTLRATIRVRNNVITPGCIA